MGGRDAATEVQAPEFDLEQVYDEQISPLMTQIIAICQQHDMPFVASFQFSSTGFCTSLIAQTPRADSRLRSAAKLIRDGYMAFMVTKTAPDAPQN